MSNLNLLAFGLYPYIALAICLIGSWARFDLSQYSWKAGSSQIFNRTPAEQRYMRAASNLFHVGVLFVLAGHFVGLLTPASVYHHVISTENKQLLAMVSGGLFGGLCLIGLLMLLKRRLCDDRVRASSSVSDILILMVLLVQLLLGLATIYASTHHMDGSVMVMLADWAQYTVTLQPVKAAASIAPVGLVYKLHVFLGLTLFVLFPFTRLVHIVSAPVWYLGRRYQIVRQKGVKPSVPRPIGAVLLGGGAGLSAVGNLTHCLQLRFQAAGQLLGTIGDLSSRQGVMAGIAREILGQFSEGLGLTVSD